jgi:2-desacetyl-2-hydroxyethyl bacteriochlorophyllide A dehydrogenase
MAAAKAFAQMKHSSMDQILSAETDSCVGPSGSQHNVQYSVPPTMNAAVLVGPQQVEIQVVPVPAPGANEILVRVEGCGVCGSNLPVWEGRPWFSYPLPPGQPGHEAWGHVVRLGSDVRSMQVGDRVAMLSYAGYAEYDLAVASAAVLLPPALGAQPFPAEPLACAMNVFARSGIRVGDTVAIIGIGFLGALLTSLAVNAGARVIAITRRPFALDIARAAGAAHTLIMDDHWRLITEVKQLTADLGCDVVIEAVGQQWPLDLAAELTRIRGRLVIAGYHQDGPRQVNMQLWNWRGLDVINAHERDEAVYMAGMRAAVDAVTAGYLDPISLYTHTLPLDQMAAAFALLTERPDGFLKALVRCN